MKEDSAMKKSRYTEEQIAFALRQAEQGTPVVEVIRKSVSRSLYNIYYRLLLT